MVYSLKLPPSEFIKLITKQNVVYAFTTSIVCSFIAAVINVIFGVILAWTLVKYDFPGKRILDGFIELPFALPTAVAGITLSKMYSDTGILGKPLAAIGIKVSYTHLGIIVALIFIGIPFVVRNVQPVLEKLDENREITALIIDPSAASFIQTVLRHGKFRVVKANNDVLTGINRVCQALKDEEIFIYPAFTDAIREFSIYRWDDNIKKDAVKKENDHAMDDIRYFVATVLGRENQNSAFASVAIERN